MNKQQENNEIILSDSFVNSNPLIYNEFDPKLENEMIYKLISKNFFLIEKLIIMNENKFSTEVKINSNNITNNLNLNNNNLNYNSNYKNNNISKDILSCNLINANNNCNTISNTNQVGSNKSNFNLFSNFKTSPNNLIKNRMGANSKTISNINSAVNSKTSLQYSFCKSEENKDFNKCDFDFPDYLHFSLIKFIKIFSKIFFNKNLSLQYSGIFQMITDIIKLENSSSLIIFIFRFLIESLTKTHGIAEAQKVLLLNEIKSIFEIITSKAFICPDFSKSRNQDSNTVNGLFIGNLMVNKDCLLKMMNFHLELNFMDPVSFEKLRKLFYNTLTRLLILHSNSTNDEEDLSNNFFEQLTDHYVYSIYENSEKLKIPDSMQNGSMVLLGLIIDSIGILQKVDTRNHYDFFIKKYFNILDCMINFYIIFRNVSLLQIVILQFFYNLTKNDFARINFHGNLGKKLKSLYLIFDFLKVYLFLN